jgi:hypothetical protein
MSALPQILLQKSFCIDQDRFSGPQARRSNSHLRDGKICDDLTGDLGNGLQTISVGDCGRPTDPAEIQLAIEEAIQHFVRKGWIVDSGQRRWSQRTGRYEIVWESKYAGDHRLSRYPQFRTASRRRAWPVTRRLRDRRSASGHCRYAQKSLPLMFATCPMMILIATVSLLSTRLNRKRSPAV